MSGKFKRYIALYCTLESNNICICQSYVKTLKMFGKAKAKLS